MSKTIKFIGLTAAALVVFGSVALADTAEVDGDTTTSAALNHANFNNALSGEACAQAAGVHTSRHPIDLGVKRTGNVNNVFANNSTVTFSQVSTSNPLVSTVLPSPATITLPSNWVASDNNTVSPLLRSHIAISTTGKSVGETILATVVHRAVGVETGTGDALPRDTAGLAVTGTVVDGSTATAEDCVPPTATITTPANNAQYAQGATVNAAYSCADAPGAGTAPASLVASCVGTVANGSPIDTSTLGSKSFIVTATDNAGNTSSTTHSYTVVAPPATYTVTFSQPIDSGNIVNKGKYGRVIPVKVNLFLDGTQLTDGSGGPLSIGSAVTPCSSAASDGIEEYSPGSSDHGTEFRWDDTQWIYNLDTSKLQDAAPNKCYRVSVVRDSKAIGSFLIQLTK